MPVWSLSSWDVRNLLWSPCWGMIMDTHLVLVSVFCILGQNFKLNIWVIWDMTACWWWIITYVPEEPAAFTFVVVWEAWVFIVHFRSKNILLKTVHGSYKILFVTAVCLRHNANYDVTLCHLWLVHNLKHCRSFVFTVQQSKNCLTLKTNTL